MKGPGTGVLPRQLLMELAKTGYLPEILFERPADATHTDVDKNFFNPASVDMPLSAEAYRLNSIFLPRRGEHVRTLLSEVGGWKHDLLTPLEVGVPYLIKLTGEWHLPEQVYGYANPKSSTGRLNLFSRLIVDGVEMYDSMPTGWKGEAWMLVRADSFPVKLAEGLAVAQLRLFDGKSFLDALRTELIIKKHGLVFSPDKKPLSYEELREWKDSLILTLAVGDNFGYESRGTHQLVDYAKTKVHPKLDYFERITPKRGAFMLRKGGFYILSTKERVMVPPFLSAELRAIDPRLGEFRSHAAGYIDPGWGFGQSGEVCGRPITLEVIPHEDMYVRDGQAIARLRFEWMKEEPDVPYDAASSNYKEQNGPQTSKHFTD
jgi:dCTP deaminase